MLQLIAKFSFNIHWSFYTRQSQVSYTTESSFIHDIVSFTTRQSQVSHMIVWYTARQSQAS